MKIKIDPSLNLYDQNIITNEEIIQLNNELSILYEYLIDKISYNLHKNLNIQNIKFIIRNNSIPIIHFFLERTFRILKANEKNKLFYLDLDYKKLNTPNNIEQFINLSVNSNLLNNYIISLLFKKKSYSVKSSIAYPPQNKIHFKRGRNFLFKTSYFPKKNLIINMIYKLSNFFLFKNKDYLCSSFGNDYYPLTNSLFGIKRILKIDLKKYKNTKTIDLDLRRRIFNFRLSEYKQSSFLNKFVDFFGQNFFDKKFNSFLINFFPIDSLECLEENKFYSENLISKYNQRKLIISGSPNYKEIFILNACKNQGYKIIGMQHGGQYGYYKGLFYQSELEYFYLDYFLSWGWEEKNELNHMSHLKIIPSPSPWLSERKNFFLSYKKNVKPKFDVIWFPQMMKVYANTVQSLSTISRDKINIHSKSILKTADVLNNCKINTLLKVYNSKSYQLMTDTFDKIYSNYEFIHFHKREDKGFHPKLTKQSKFLIFDQPGTGFFECLVYKIPVIVIWEQYFSYPEKSSLKDFEMLFDNKVIHYNIENAIKTIKDNLNTYKFWYEDQKRKIAVEKFINKYCYNDLDWQKNWNNLKF